MTPQEQIQDIVDYLKYNLDKLVRVGGITAEASQLAIKEFLQTDPSEMQDYADDIVNEIQDIIETIKLQRAAAGVVNAEVFVGELVNQTAKFQQDVLEEKKIQLQQEKLQNLTNIRSSQPGAVLSLEDLVNPNSVRNQNQKATSFEHTSSLASVNENNNKTYNSVITTPPLPTPAPVQAQNIPQNIPQNNFQSNNQNPQGFQPMPTYNNPSQYYPQNPQPAPPIPAQNPNWRPGVNLVRPPK